MIPRQEFGRTGHASTRVIFGAYALNEATQSEADAALELLLEYGVNHIDTAPMYGKAEKLIGQWLTTYRDHFFVATKTRSRSYQGAMDNLRRSLERLRVDHIDLWQMHGLTNPHGRDRALGPGGTLSAFLEAREEGLVHFLGITGHGLRAAEMHLHSLERFGFDSVMLAYNYSLAQDSRYAASFNELDRVCQERGIALQTMKAIARRPWTEQERLFNTYFYEPLVTQEAIDVAVHWVLGHPRVLLISAGDLQLLPRILAAAEGFETRPSDRAMIRLTETNAIEPIFK